MHPATILVDGNNLLHVWKDRDALARDFATARWTLARTLDQLAGALDATVVVIFDGTIGGRDPGLGKGGAEVIFASRDTTADTVIERRVRDAARPQEVLVVTSDLGVQRTIAAAGAEVMGCEPFLAWAEDRLRTLRTQLKGQRKRGHTLGDYLG